MRPFGGRRACGRQLIRVNELPGTHGSLPPFFPEGREYDETQQPEPNCGQVPDGLPDTKAETIDLRSKCVSARSGPGGQHNR
jgi:hypothetical protein